MKEYRIQTQYGDGWRFVTDRRGKFYTYDSEATARRHGPAHAPKQYNQETKQWVPVLDRFRIVYSDIEWHTLDM